MQSEYLTEARVGKTACIIQLLGRKCCQGLILEWSYNKQFLFLFLCSLLIFVVFFEILGLRLFVCLCIWPYIFTTQLQPTTLTIFI